MVTSKLILFFFDFRMLMLTFSQFSYISCYSFLAYVIHSYLTVHELPTKSLMYYLTEDEEESVKIGPCERVCSRSTVS